MIGPEALFFVSLGGGLAGIFLLMLLPKKMIDWCALCSSLAIALSSGSLAVSALMGNSVDASVYAGSFMGRLPFCVDGLSAWFLIVVNFGLVWAVYHAHFHFKTIGDGHRLRLHYLALVVLHQSLIWVCTVQNGFAFLFAWEVMSLSSALLLSDSLHHPKGLKAVVHYLVQMHIGGMFLAVGFIWMVLATGSFSFDAFGRFLANNGSVWPFLLFFVGFGLKAEFVPLHGKVPHVYPFASPHVAAVFSGVMVKMGIYGILRVVFSLQENWLLLGEIVLSVSIFTSIYGVLNSAVHRDIKRMLAYCTIENIGIIGIGIGLGMIGTDLQMPWLVYLGFGGALLHVLNHALAKTLLFYSGGWAMAQAGSNHMDRMGGLGRHMPQTSVFFLLGALALSGIPPLNGFVSEFMLYGGFVEGLKADKIELVSLLVIGIGALAFTGGVALLAFSKTYGVVFLGVNRSSATKRFVEASYWQLLPQYVIVAVMISVALFPSFYMGLVNGVLAQQIPNLSASETAMDWGFAQFPGRINLYALALMGIVLLVWLWRKAATRRVSKAVGPTWGCGYAVPSKRLQYTGKSFSKPLGKMFAFFLVERKNYIELGRGELFPRERKYASHYHDVVETRLLDVVLQRLVYAANYFKFIQNGRVQSYVLYGIVFILVVFVLTLFNVMP